MAAEPNVLTNEDRHQLEQRLLAFEQNWTPVSLVALASSLPAVGSPLRPALILGLSQIDLRRRWQIGEQPSVEEYLLRYPDLGTTETVPVELVLVEYLARERAGLKPRPEHFDRRFPGKRVELERMVDPVSPNLGNSNVNLGSGSGVNLGSGNSGTRLLGSDSGRQRSIADTSDEETSIPAQFGRYRILKQLGQGGMGTVYLAVDARLDRQVALKVPRFAPGTNDENLQRFYREARATATIAHPNLCPLYDIGEVDGIPYLTMPFIEGWPLSRFTTREKRLSQFAIAATTRKIALAVHEAHKVGVIHRDLKPSNIMVNKRGEPIVMDFGLARWVHNDKEDIRLTKAGAILGAPVYMSPEQVYGDAESIGPACDVYSLGVILFELITNRLPFEGANTTAVLAKTLMLEAPRPSVFRPDVDPLLEAICVRTMAKRPQDRYPTMQALADALSEYMRQARPDAAGRSGLSQSGSGTRLQVPATQTEIPVSPPTQPMVPQPTPADRAGVVPATPTQPATRGPDNRIAAGTGKRKPTDSYVGILPSGRARMLPWLLVGLGVLGLFALPVLAVLFYRQVVPRGDLLLVLLPESAVVEIKLDGQPFDRSRVGKPFSLDAGEHQVSVTSKLFEDIEQTVRIESGKVNQVEIDLRVRRSDQPHLAADAPFPALRSPVRAMALSGTMSVALSGGDDYEVAVWSLDRHAITHSLVGHTLPVTSVAIDRSGGVGISCAGDRTVRVWDVRKGEQRHRLLGHNDWPRCVAMDWNGKLAVSGDDLGVLFVWDVVAGISLRSLPGHVGSVRAVVLASDGKRCLSGGDDGTIRWWDADTGKPIHVMVSQGGPVRSVALAPTMKLAASGHEDGAIRLWNLDTGRELRVLHGHSGQVRGLAFPTPDRLHSASAGVGDNTVRVWDAVKGTLVHMVGESPAPFNALVCSTDATMLFTGCEDARLRGFAAGKKLDRPLPPMPSSFELKQTRRIDVPTAIERLALLPDGTRALFSGLDGVVYNQDLGPTATRSALRGHKGPVRSLAVSADGRFVATGGSDKQIRVWDLQANTSQTLDGHTAEVLTVAFVPDGQSLASGSIDKTVLVWDLAKRAVRHRFTGHTDAVTGVQLTPDGKRLISVGLDGHFKVWDPVAGSALQSGQIDKSGFRCVAIFPDGKRAITGGRDKFHRIWDIQTGKPLTGVQTHSGPVSAVAISACGRWYATAGEEGTLYRWNSETNAAEQRIGGISTRPISSLAFTPDGRSLVSGSLDRAMKFWAIAREDADPAPLPASAAAREPAKKFTGAKGDLETAAISRDGKTILAVGMDRNAFVWDVSTGKMRQLVGGQMQRLHGCALFPDGKQAATCGWDNVIRIWDLATSKATLLTGHTAPVVRVAVSADGRFLISGSKDRTVRVWDAASGRTLQTLEGHTAEVWSVAISTDGYRAVSGGYDRTVRFWDLATGRPIGGWVGTGDIHAVALSPDGKRVAAGGKDRVVVLLDVETSAVIARLPGHEGTIAGVSFSPDGRWIASASDDGTARVWNVETGREVYRAAVAPKGVWSATFSADGKQLLTTSNEPLVTLWDLPAELGIVRVGFERTLATFAAQVDRLAISPDGQTVAAACTDKTLSLLDLAGEKKPLEGLKLSARYVAFAADGKQLLATCEDGTSRLWSIPDGAPGRVFTGHSKWVWIGAYSPDGKRILTGGQDPWLLLHDLTGPDVQRFEGYPTGVHCLTFLPDGRRAILGGLNGSLGVWDLATGEELQRWAGTPGSAVSALSLSPDARLLATCGYDGFVRLWEIATGRLLQTFSASLEQLWTVSFDPSGQRIAAGGKDGVVRLWEFERGVMTEYAGHLGGVTAVRFTPDGRRMLSSSQDKSIRVWGLPAL